jgi:hypothetical protein
MIGLPALAVVAAAWAFTGSAWGAALLLLMLASLLAQLGGAMYLAGIQVNAGGPRAPAGRGRLQQGARPAANALWQAGSLARARVLGLAP